MDQHLGTGWQLACADYFLGASVFAVVAGALLVSACLATSFLAGAAGAVAAGAVAAATGALAGSAAKAETATRDAIKVKIAFILVSF
jgi:hypothetical protein